MKRLLLASLLLVSPCLAQTVVNTPRGIVVAHDGVVELQGRWRVAGAGTPARIVVGPDRIALLDPIANEVRTIELASGRASRATSGETPIDGVFIGRDLFVLARDARTLERMGDGARVAVPADPAFVRNANGMLYVYSRLEGIVTEISPSSFAIRRRVRVAPFASAFEIDGGSGYLVVPREGKIRTFSLASMQVTGAIDAGAVPVDLAQASAEGALTARTLAVADPSAKKVWLIEGAQSTAQAVARGFIRGLLGLGLYSNHVSQFPTGIDRVFIRGSLWVAYDSSSGTLYRFTKSSSRPLATEVAPSAFALTPEGVALWRHGRLEKCGATGALACRVDSWTTFGQAEAPVPQHLTDMRRASALIPPHGEKRRHVQEDRPCSGALIAQRSLLSTHCSALIAQHSIAQHSSLSTHSTRSRNPFRYSPSGQ